MQNVNIQGTVTFAGQALIIFDSVINGQHGNSALVSNGGALTAYNSSFLNSGVNPAMLLNSGTVDLSSCIISNSSGSPADFGVDMANTFQSGAYFRGCRFPGGSNRFVNNSNVYGNWFDSNTTDILYIELQNAQTKLNFEGNVVNGNMVIIKNDSQSDASISVLGNTIHGSTFDVNITNNTAFTIFTPHVQVRDNIIYSAAITTMFTANSISPNVVIYANNYLGGPSITHTDTTPGGVITQVFMIENQIPDAPVVYNQLLVFLQGNIMDSSGIPLTINCSAAIGDNFTLLYNWMNARNEETAVIDVNLVGLYNLKLLHNTMLSNGVPLLLITNLVGATVQSNGLNTDMNASTLGVIPTAIPNV